ncbi:MAG: SWIM zinc finger family protein [Methanomicrobium sp.]|nr:SWIM zinc finger family protein [Methanomicrobium sp.]
MTDGSKYSYTGKNTDKDTVKDTVKHTEKEHGKDCGKDTGKVSYSIKLDAQRCEDIRSIYGKKADNALTAVEEGRVYKYLDFFVVKGNTGEYVVVDDFCTCQDFAFRQIECWHILAVRIARYSGDYTCIDEWYLDRLLKNNSESESGKQ